MSCLRRLFASLALAVFGLLAMDSPADGASVADFQVFSLAGSTAATSLPGRLYVPPEAAGGPRPMIVFLHGAGEAGTNNTLQVNVNIDNLLAEAKKRGAYLYAPQAVSGNSGWNPVAATDRVMSMVDRALAEQNVDPTRLYLTGLSMGGGGAWSMLSRYGNRFAAAVPICGVAPGTDFTPANLLDVPTWAFHARNDSTVAVGNTRNRVNSILAAAGEAAPTYPATNVLTDFQVASSKIDLLYTEYYTGGHGIWTRVYNGTTNQAMYDWMFAHAIPEPAGAAMAAIALAASAGNRRKNRGTR